MYQIKEAIGDGIFKGKVGKDVIATMDEKCDNTIRWIDRHDSATQDELRAKLKQLEKFYVPIITSVCQGQESD